MHFSKILVQSDDPSIFDHLALQYLLRPIDIVSHIDISLGTKCIFVSETLKNSNEIMVTQH